MANKLQTEQRVMICLYVTKQHRKVLCEETVMGTVQGSRVIISSVNYSRHTECPGAKHISFH